MRKQTNFVILVVLSFPLVFSSCKKEDLGSKPITEESQTSSEMIRLGKKLENPFTIQNMSKALDNLYSSARLTENVSVETSHLYIKFKPKTEEQLDLLKKDSTLDLYSYPLDYEIVEGGAYYHDPSLPAEQPTYQYASVLENYKFPAGVDYEILAECYIPDDLPSTSSANARKLSEETADALIEEAFRITGNKLDNSASENLRITASKWTPKGKIQVWDDSSPNLKNTGRYVAIEGIEVKARNWLTTREGFTNINGDFTCNGTLRGSAKYTFKWERHHYSIRSGSVGQAEYNGPEKTGNWDLNILGGTQQYWAHIFRGAYHCYYKDILGLKRPPLNEFGKPQMKIGAFVKGGRANHDEDRRLLGIRNQVRMYNAFDEDENDDIPAIQYKTSDFVATIIHELAHASHWELRKGDWDNATNNIVQESWALCVETYITKTYFYSWFDDKNSSFFNFKTINNKDIDERKYTGYFIDIIDNHNQLYDLIGSNIVFVSDMANDQVTGYSIKQIEDVLKNCGSLDDVKDQLKNTYVNNTEQYLDNLTEQYKQLKQIIP